MDLAWSSWTVRALSCQRPAQNSDFAGRDTLGGLWTRPSRFFSLLKSQQNRFSLPHATRKVCKTPIGIVAGKPGTRIINRASIRAPAAPSLVAAAAAPAAGSLCPGVPTRAKALRPLIWRLTLSTRRALCRTATVISGVRGAAPGVRRATLEATTPPSRRASSQRHNKAP